MVITELRQALEGKSVGNYEIIVADNGSSDGSQDIARARGVRVISVAEPGYGRVLSAGILAAVSPHVVFADADGTYPTASVAELYGCALEAGADLGLASRIGGHIEPGAMPWLHRYIGTPFFTSLINLLYGGHVTDCGTGLRYIRRDWFLSNPHHATGMEFASEILIRAMKTKAIIVEIPGGLRCDAKNRQPHLKTWRDGMRHLMFILAERPALFERFGLVVCLFGSLLQMGATWHGPLEVGVFDIFGLHTQLLALLSATLGSQLYFMGVLLYDRSSDQPSTFTRTLLKLSEDKLFFSLLGACGLGVLVMVAVIIVWWQGHFSGISAERELMGAVHLTVLLGCFSLGLFGAHINKVWGRSPRTSDFTPLPKAEVDR